MIANIIYKHTVASTNDELKAIAKTVPNGTILTAKTQTQGKGRLGRVWHGGDNNIAMSLILKRETGFPLNTLSMLPLAVGVCSALAIEDTVPIHVDLKWCNDLIIGRVKKKVGGILVESIFNDNLVKQVVIGIGINANSYPENIQTSTSIANEISEDVNTELLFNNLVDHLNILSCLEDSDILSKYKDRCINLGKEVSFSMDNNKMQGFVLDINELGHLVVKTDNKIITLSSGEASIRLANGEYI